MTARLARPRLSASITTLPKHPVLPKYSLALSVAVVALGITALINRSLAKKAERENPPAGSFMNVDGVRLHYVDQGSGEPVVLLHGNGSMIEDFASSGLIEMASRKHRVIAFDRPGFGHSARPRGTVWTPEAQADLIYRALRQIGVTRAKVFGHSWGASVAVALAVKHPEMVASLIVASGYYYPTPRADVLLLSGPAIPLAGDILSHTVAPILGRLLWPLVLRKIFGPAKVPAKFRSFPKEMALRPSQIRASAAETALMIPGAFALRGKYTSLTMPVVIVAGEQDRLVDIEAQSARLHREVTSSKLRRVTNAGHMVHQTATVLLMSAIDEAGQPWENGRHHGGPREAA